MEGVIIFLALIVLFLFLDKDGNSGYTVGHGVVSGNQKFCSGEKLLAVYISDNVVKFSVRDRNYCGDPFVYLNAVVQHVNSLSNNGVKCIVQSQSVIVTYRDRSQAERYVEEICRIS